MTFVSARTGPRCRTALKIDRRRDAVRGEQVRQALNGQFKQAGDAADRNMAPVDGASEDIDEKP